ncbi:MAG TPA: hypothetical protein VFF73_35975 [Planctomycetota bacterium]|nr:hypothetical protein [Planctomycetota bacterium]
MSNNGYDPLGQSYGLELRLDTAYEGIDKVWPEGVEKLPLRGKWYTKDDMKALIDAERQPWKKLRAAKAVIRQFSIDKKGHKETAGQLLDDLKVTMSSQHGAESEQLVSMGFKPRRKRRPLTSQQAADANEKRQKTRKERGVMGRKQRAALKFEGDVTVRVAPDGSAEIVPAPSSPPPPASETQDPAT